MKQRITYILPRDTVADPETIAVGDDHLNFTKTTQAAEEWKLTLGKADLPDEV